MSILKPGDIVVFKAGDDWLGKSIAWLTESDVSHAAIILENDRLAEMGASGIHVGGIEVHDGGNTMVLRLSPERDSAPLMEAAQKYIDCKTRYDFPALVILAGMIIYRKIRPTPRLVAIIDLTLRAACSALDSLIQHIVLKNPDKAMVCSQLVYQVYNDCGKNYRIELSGGLLQAGSGDMSAADGMVRLIDLAESADRLTSPTGTPGITNEKEIPSEEEIAKELYLALSEQDTQGNDLECAAPPCSLGDLPSWCARFVEQLEEFLEKSQQNIPIDALFVTPADLAYKAENLAKIGKVELKRLP